MGFRAGNEIAYAPPADDGKANRTPSAWIIMPPILARGQNSVPDRVLSVGHSNRAQVGHSCLAPRNCRLANESTPGRRQAERLTPPPPNPAGCSRRARRATPGGQIRNKQSCPEANSDKYPISGWIDITIKNGSVHGGIRGALGRQVGGLSIFSVKLRRFAGGAILRKSCNDSCADSKY